ILIALFLYAILPNILADEPVKLNEKKPRTDANVVGHVVCNSEHIPFATIMIKGTTIGTTSDETGHFQLINMPTGEMIISVSMIGYSPKEKTIILKKSETMELKFELEEDVMNLDEIVISADRNAQKRTDAAVIVNAIGPQLFSTTQSFTLGESLNFTPGLRLENNCQNCGFSQVRMNGMEGAYSQILINSRSIFSGLAGVYGLELIPTHMIERIEVVRGGGSALFGSNAIAGTVNIILKDPIRNSYEGGLNYSLIGLGVDGAKSPASDVAVNFNGTIDSDDKESGLSLYGFTRKRTMFDANDDGYSEIAELENLTFGARAFHKFNYRDKLVVDFFAINENRSGGNKFDYVNHERDISETLTHDMRVAALTYERFFRDYDMLSVYASGQSLGRDSYYGANKSVDSYGFTQSYTYNVGAQYKAVLGDHSSLVAGIETTGDYLEDKKLGYADYANVVIVGDSIIQVPHTDNTLVADQVSTTTGMFAQYNIRIQRLKISAGLRLDHYDIQDNVNPDQGNTGNVLSPRLSFMYDVAKHLQLRTSYSQGYRAPQIFDEDLHIETSGARTVTHQNDVNLKQETSNSFMLSMDFNKMLGKVYTGFLMEGFYTQLNDAFISEIGAPDANGTVVYTRTNSAGGAMVAGVNMELKLKPMCNFSFTSGFTFQKSEYETPEETFNETSFFRTPNTYGFVALDWDFVEHFCLSATGNYTGDMLLPYFGVEVPEGELRNSTSFYDVGTKVSYRYKLNGASVEFSAGIKNIFNSYQSDFDRGINRDPAYIYGPLNPRTVYFGVKFGNLL
ncbi:MAG: TonB-dependent receptor, partial [Bacteroidales bacterium]|nr:TonB-dependent receptor [Bacteroidales bacterium]